MELLWENASPTSDFAAQTISIDLSAYELVAVEVGGAGVSFMRVDGAGINVGTHFGYALGRSRTFSAKTYGVVCGEGKQGYWNSGSEWSTSNTDAVPYRFYGIKS